ncbi:MAG TPA: hypothetical protein DHV85_12820, partial [Candidatus Accumulibacter sp.]|nr:hypothetical protein [Accumulibacter sp.]
MGNGQPARLDLSPFFNAIVGGRGTGKSTVVHALRLATARADELHRLADDAEPRRRFADFCKVAKGRDGEGALRYFVERMRPLPAPVQPHGDRSIIGRSPAIRQALELVSRVAPSVAAVLLEGESGTGKELLAQAVHAASPRASGPFITVDCSGIPETLFESEVFGHERGA